MRRTHWLLALLAACGDGGVIGALPDGGGLELELVTGGLDAPLFLTAPPGDDRLFVLEQPGTIRIIDGGVLQSEPFLDLRDRVLDGGERGLLGLAFHPGYAANGAFFVNYTDTDGDTRVERYVVSADPDVADPASARLVLAIDQPFSNHNGGMLAFAPDGTLWIGTGDGGGAGDPDENGQDLSSLLRKILRIDVDGGSPYAVPADNPFASGSDARPEIWALGLRNPWRFSFDAPSGDVYVADVGQNTFEEINRVPADRAGVNYGWNVMEGAHCFAAQSCDATGLEPPILESDHGEGCSVTGGYARPRRPLFLRRLLRRLDSQLPRAGDGDDGSARVGRGRYR